jgi:hypothetical protein
MQAQYFDSVIFSTAVKMLNRWQQQQQQQQHTKRCTSASMAAGMFESACLAACYAAPMLRHPFSSSTHGTCTGRESCTS